MPPLSRPAARRRCWRIMRRRVHPNSPSLAVFWSLSLPPPPPPPPPATPATLPPPPPLLRSIFIILVLASPHPPPFFAAPLSYPCPFFYARRGIPVLRMRREREAEGGRGLIIYIQRDFSCDAADAATKAAGSFRLIISWFMYVRKSRSNFERGLMWN